MGYFANGTEGEVYEAKYCNHCVNQDDCPIWLIHLLYNYGQEGEVEDILSAFIPRKGVTNLQCKMYRPTERKQQLDAGQLEMEF